MFENRGGGLAQVEQKSERTMEENLSAFVQLHLLYKTCSVQQCITTSLYVWANTKQLCAVITLKLSYNSSYRDDGVLELSR